jgi:hypothetical protein
MLLTSCCFYKERSNSVPRFALKAYLDYANTGFLTSSIECKRDAWQPYVCPKSTVWPVGTVPGRLPREWRLYLSASVHDRCANWFWLAVAQFLYVILFDIRDAINEVGETKKILVGCWSDSGWCTWTCSGVDPRAVQTSLVQCGGNTEQVDGSLPIGQR